MFVLRSSGTLLNMEYHTIMISVSNPCQKAMLSHTLSSERQSKSSKHLKLLYEHPIHLHKDHNQGTINLRDKITIRGILNHQFPSHLLHEEQTRPAPQTPYWSPRPPQMSPGPLRHAPPWAPHTPCG